MQGQGRVLTTRKTVDGDGDDVDLDLLCQGKWEKIGGAQDTAVEVHEHINLMALDIIMKCAFSQETNCQTNRSVTGKQKKEKKIVQHYLGHLLTHCPTFLFLF